MDEKVIRKVSPTGVLSFQGQKYAVKDKRLMGQEVEIVQHPDQVSVLCNNIKEPVQPFKMHTRVPGVSQVVIVPPWRFEK